MRNSLPHLLDDAVEVELLAQHPVVSLLGLLEHFEVTVEVLLTEEGGAVDALEHLPLLVASPVGSCGAQQLEVLHSPRGRYMGTPTQIEERAVTVDGDDLVLVELLEPLELQRIVGKQLAGLVRGDPAALERERLLHDLGHLRLDGLQLLRGEGLLDLEVVIEAVIDGRAEADPCIRIDLSHRGRKDVSCRVA